MACEISHMPELVKHLAKTTCLSCTTLLRNRGANVFSGVREVTLAVTEHNQVRTALRSVFTHALKLTGPQSFSLERNSSTKFRALDQFQLRLWSVDMCGGQRAGGLL